MTPKLPGRATDLLNQTLVAAGSDRIQASGLAAGIGVPGKVQGTYATEVLRGAILTVPPLMLARRISLPAMLGCELPGPANLWLIATKDTAVLAVVGFAELTLETRQAAGAAKHYLTFFIAAGAFYLIITLVSGHLFARADRWARRGEPGIGPAGR